MKKNTYRKLIWTTIRTLTFLIIGLMNTVIIKPEDIGKWKNYDTLVEQLNNFTKTYITNIRKAFERLYLFLPPFPTFTVTC